MNTDIREGDQSTIVLEVQITDKELQNAINEGVRHLARRTRIPGFRPGKAPRAMIERAYGIDRSDPDAPDPQAPKMTWVHWVLFNLPPGTSELPDGVASAALPEGTGEGVNDWKRTGYGGPCPPIGRHRYYHKLYALDVRLEGLKNPSKAQVESAMQGHVLDEAQLIGTYQKHK